MRSQSMYLCEFLIGNKKSKFFYAVGRGKEIGVYTSWEDCKTQVHRFSNSKYKKFNSHSEAIEYVNSWNQNLVSEVKSDVDGKSIGSKENGHGTNKTLQFPSTETHKLTSIARWTPTHPTKSINGNSNEHLKDYKTFNCYLKEIKNLSQTVSSLKLDIQELKNNLSVKLNETNKRFQVADNSINLEKTEKVKKTRKKSSCESTKCSADKPENTPNSITEAPRYFTYDNENYVSVYTDGSAFFDENGIAKASIGVWFGENHPLNFSKTVDGTPTSNSAEIQAARMAIQVAKEFGIKKLKILTDSSFLISCMTKWMEKWKENGWMLYSGKTPKHKAELIKLNEECSEIEIKWEKVAAHKGVIGNESAHKLANKVKSVEVALKEKKFTKKHQA